MAQVDTKTELYLVPPGTLVEASGDAEAFAVPTNGPRLFVCRLEITEIIEQESLELSLWGSPDGQNWGTMPLIKFPQRFYTGTSQMVLDLSLHPEVKFIRARWGVNRWGRGRPRPRFRFGVSARPAA